MKILRKVLLPVLILLLVGLTVYVSYLWYANGRYVPQVKTIGDAPSAAIEKYTELKESVEDSRNMFSATLDYCSNATVKEYVVKGSGGFYGFSISYNEKGQRTFMSSGDDLITLSDTLSGLVSRIAHFDRFLFPLSCVELAKTESWILPPPPTR